MRWQAVCQTCSTSNILCPYTNQDLRLKGARAPADEIADLRVRKLILDQIFQATLQGKEHRILNKIRSGASLTDVVRSFVDEAAAADLILGVPQSAAACNPETYSYSQSNSDDCPSSFAQDGAVVLETSSSSGQATLCDSPTQKSEPPLQQVKAGSAELTLWSIAQRESDGTTVFVEIVYRAVTLSTQAIMLTKIECQNTTSSYLVPHYSGQNRPLERNQSATTFPPRGLRGSNQTYQRNQRSELKLRNFGNLPFSSAIYANHMPARHKAAQLRLLRRPD